MAIVLGAGADFPQTGSNRTRQQMTDEIASYAGGGSNRPDIVARAGNALDAAVREFNTGLWKFNRMTQDLTLLNDTADYPLNATFRAPMKAMLIDSGGETVNWLQWIDYDQWQALDPDPGTATVPEVYTARNFHETGLLTLSPKPITPFSYPTVRLHYFRRIALAQTVGSKLAVPIEVEEAIVQLGIARMIATIRTFAEGRDAFILARDLRLNVEQTWRDWEDF